MRNLAVFNIGQYDGLPAIVYTTDMDLFLRAYANIHGSLHELQGVPGLQILELRYFESLISVNL